MMGRQNLKRFPHDLAVLILVCCAFLVMCGKNDVTDTTLQFFGITETTEDGQIVSFGPGFFDAEDWLPVSATLTSNLFVQPSHLKFLKPFAGNLDTAYIRLVNISGASVTVSPSVGGTGITVIPPTPVELSPGEQDSLGFIYTLTAADSVRDTIYLLTTPDDETIIIEVVAGHVDSLVPAVNTLAFGPAYPNPLFATESTVLVIDDEVDPPETTALVFRDSLIIPFTLPAGQAVKMWVTPPSDISTERFTLLNLLHGYPNAGAYLEFWKPYYYDELLQQQVRWPPAIYRVFYETGGRIYYGDVELK